MGTVVKEASSPISAKPDVNFFLHSDNILFHLHLQPNQYHDTFIQKIRHLVKYTTLAWMLGIADTF